MTMSDERVRAARVHCFSLPRVEEPLGDIGSLFEGGWVY